MARLLIVANRLPVTVSVHHGKVSVDRSAGGLSTGLSGTHEKREGLWIGWPGETSSLTPEQRAAVDQKLAERRAVPLYLTSSEVSRYYDGFSNSVLWPLFHYLVDRVPLQPRGWDAYWKVNQRFCDLVVSQHQSGDVIWVHDYQLMLVPGMLRQRLPEATIGFFLHIPFPAADIFRILPWRAAILNGLLGADLIGFHTFSYLNHFAASVLRVLGREVTVDRLDLGGREVRLGVFPMGVDAKAISQDAELPEVLREVEVLRKERRDLKVLLGIDRLDYTKGIPRRLLAMERLFERDPSLRGKVQLVQVSVPSREKVDAYAESRRQADELVGRINGLFSSITRPAIQYLYRSLSPRQVIALYRAADVMVVTPLRDGMNLVAKEFVAARNDLDGVLLLSEFAGAAAEMPDALLVNPYDLDDVATNVQKALALSRDERRSRMELLRMRVFSNDVHEWAESFLESLERSKALAKPAPMPKLLLDGERRDVVRQLRASTNTVLFLDYDGTLVSFAKSPGLAAPDARLLELLAALASSGSFEVHIVSGRDKETLERWFGHLPIGIHAEHGFWSRSGAGAEWKAIRDVPEGLKESVRPILDEFVRRTPGSFVEEKSASLAWHYRMADAELAVAQSRELVATLGSSLRFAPLQLLRGEKVIEVRLQDVHKGLVVTSVLSGRSEPDQVVAIGDDHTDEDMFAALPSSAFSIHVGARPSRAMFRVDGVDQVRGLLESLVG